MISFATLTTVALASFLLAVVPGPTVSLIIANSLRFGTRAGVLNVAGTALGDVVLITVVAFGLSTVINIVGEFFFWIKLVGAAYLIWIGISMLRSDGVIDTEKRAKKPKIGFFWQGFFVVLSNPKALFFFGAFLPQFVDYSRDTFWQVVSLGIVFTIVASTSDYFYALLAGNAGKLLTRSKVRAAEIFSGVFLIFGGVWLAFTKQV